MSSKNPKRFRRLEIDGIVANGQARRLRRLLPYE
jgi:ribosomal protein L35